MYFHRIEEKGRQICNNWIYLPPPNSKLKEFNYQYKTLLTKLETEKKEIILGMDHNLDWLKSNTHIEMQKFIDINFDNYIFPCIT